MPSLILTGIGHLTTNDGDAVEDAAVLIDEGVIEFAGPSADAPDQGAARRIECEGRAVVPGFVDAHTHLVFAGDRSDEFARRVGGESYQHIAESGGGILSTVAATRAASEDDLFVTAAARLRRMIQGGTTTVEIKSGYGLDLRTELAMLRVARRLGDELPVTVRTTFLGAHSVPPEHAADPDGYAEFVVREMLPAVEGLAEFCDVFVEEGIFDVGQARAIFQAGMERGMRPRVHAEQLSHSGGAALAAELGAASADHLDQANAEDASLLARAGVAAVLVPGASFSLRSIQAPVSLLAEAGCTLALASDCNPGTSYLESMSLVIALGVIEMGMTVDAALHAATRGGALSLGEENRGVIAPGFAGDLVVLDAPNPTHLAYRPATNLVWATIKEGAISHRVG